MRPHGQTKLGFFPLPIAEAQKIKTFLSLTQPFSALDPCVGNGATFKTLLNESVARLYGIEVDANRAEKARALDIETLQANTMDVRCPSESLSLLYLNPPYDWECGESNNQRLEYVFLDHTFRWLKPMALLIFVIPQAKLAKCARLLAEHFTDIRVFRLTEPECVQYQQIVILAYRRKRYARLPDASLVRETLFLETLSAKNGLEPLAETSAAKYEVPPSGPLLW